MNSLRTVIHSKDVTLHPPPAALYAQRDAFRFPDVSVCSLSGEEAALAEGGVFGGRLTLLGCAGSNFAKPMVDGWVCGVSDAVEAAGGAAAGGAGGGSRGEAAVPLQAMWLSLVEGSSPILLRWMRSPLLFSMRMSVSSERHSRFYTHFGDATALRKQMQMTNRYLGYVCLVDGSGVVRWHVHGNEPPSDEEVEGLAKLVVRAASR